MSLYIPSNYFKLVGKPRSKTLVIRVTIRYYAISMFDPIALSPTIGPLSTPPLHQSHRRPRKAWNSLNVSFDWKSDAGCHEGDTRVFVARRAISSRTLQATFYIFPQAWTLSFLFARRRRRSSFFRPKDFEHSIFSTSSSFFFSHLEWPPCI